MVANAYKKCRLIFLMAVLFGCGEANRDAAPPPVSLETGAVARQLKGVRWMPVQGFNGPGQTPFAVHVREGGMVQYPCGSCHLEVLSDGPSTYVQRRWAHRDIQQVHPQRANCQTCHNYDDLQTLKLEDGSAVGFDQAYQLCARCHFDQARDWAGGAHGKRMGGWKGVRVVMNCTDCHNPHAPTFAPRTPLPGPRIPRTGAIH